MKIFFQNNKVTLVVMLVAFLLPGKLLAFGLFDGGMLQGMDSQCSCSGGQTIRVQSYVDQSQHVYLYQPGATQLYANFNIMQSGGFFLTTLVPVAICLDAALECEGSEGQTPEGIFLMVGTSMQNTGKSLFSILENNGGVKEFVKAGKWYGSSFGFGSATSSPVL